MRCIDYRPTVVVTGQSALHLALPIARLQAQHPARHDLGARASEHDQAQRERDGIPHPRVHAETRPARQHSLHEKARTGKQVELANALLRSREYDGPAARKIPLAIAACSEPPWT